MSFLAQLDCGPGQPTAIEFNLLSLFWFGVLLFPALSSRKFNDRDVNDSS